MILLLLAVAAGLWLLFALRAVILLLLLSMLFAYLIAPLVEFLCRPVTWGRRPWAIPRPLAIAMVYLALFVTVGVAGYVLLPLLGAQVTEFGRQIPNYMTYARDQLLAWQHFIKPDHFPQGVREAIDRTVARTVDAAGVSLSHGFGDLLPILGYLPWFILIPVVAFFLLKDGAAFRRNILLTLPRGRLRGRGAEVLADINDALAAYMRAALLACLLVGVLCTIGFVLIGVPYALLFGVVAGLLEFIPLVGPLAVALGATLVTSFHSINQALWVVAFLGALRVAQDYVVFPRLVRRGIHMHPLGVILAILSGAELAGMAGIFLAIPAVAVLSVIHRHLLEHRGSGGLVSELLKPAQSAPEAARTTSDPAASPITCPPTDTPALEPHRKAVGP
ncbi:MAG TPA: AI-2E family transporter [Vicinamibacterales bacterium]|nr:AI-2E family transporter [Vicinamibacterales bacterium]